MTYEEKMNEILEANMTEKGYKLWKAVKGILPDIWDKPTSSTGKYHKKSNGRVPSIIEHTFEMIYAGIKLFRMFDIKKNTSDADTLLLGIALHDSLKYGLDGNRKHTDNKHDRLAADMVKTNKYTFTKILTENQFNMLEESIRYHSGRWSSDLNNESNFNTDNFHSQTFFVHILDMLSTADVLKTDFKV